MPEEEFTENVEGLIAIKLEKPKSLKMETSIYVSEILHPKMYIFDRSTFSMTHTHTQKNQQHCTNNSWITTR